MEDTQTAQSRLGQLLEDQRPQLEAGIAEAEAQLLNLRAREAELLQHIRRARLALGEHLAEEESFKRRMTLHEAMRLVLREHGEPMAGKDLAAEINRRGLYGQKDGSPVPLNQVHARASNYGDLFVGKDGRRIWLQPSARSTFPQRSPASAIRA